MYEYHQASIALLDQIVEANKSITQGYSVDGKHHNRGSYHPYFRNRTFSYNWIGTLCQSRRVGQRKCLF